MFWDKTGLHWLYLYEAGCRVPEEFEIIDFKGGLYAVATDIDQKTDMESLKRQMSEFFTENGFELDSSRPELGNIITPPLAREVMGYEQMDYYTPVKRKE